MVATILLSAVAVAAHCQGPLGAGEARRVAQDSVRPAPLVCTTGELFAGDPRDTNSGRYVEDGSAALGASVPWRGLATQGNRLITHGWDEVWFTDLSSREPVVRRLAGREVPADRTPVDLPGHVLRRPPGDSARPKFSAGACRTDARFLLLNGIAALPNGDLVLIDYNANAVLQIRDPFGTGCTVEYVAGTSSPLDDVPDELPNEGDADGPGVRARFAGLSAVTAGANGEVFVVEDRNGRIRRIGADRNRTVTTVGSLPPSWEASSMAWLRGRLFVTANGGDHESAIFEVDPSTGATRALARGSAEWGRLEGEPPPVLAGAATDGTGIFAMNHGRIFHVTLDGAIRHVAGNGTFFTFSRDYDPLASHPAMELELEYSVREGPSLLYHDGFLYFSTPRYLVRIACR